MALKPLLRGAGQVMFQNHAGTGLFFLVGVAVGSPLAVTVAALLGLIVSTATTTDRSEGLGGYNGILVGAALGTFLAPQPGLVLLGALATPPVMRALTRLTAAFGVSALTAPFVLVTWLLLLSSHLLTALVPAPPAATMELALGFWPDAVLQGVSQVFLVQNPLTGILFLIGLALSSRWAAGLALAGSALGAGLGVLTGAPVAAVQAGLYGFSPVLTAIALGCTFFPPTGRNLIYAGLAVVFTFFAQAALNAALQPLALPALTAPFVLVTWLFQSGAEKGQQVRVDEVGVDGVHAVGESGVDL